LNDGPGCSAHDRKLSFLLGFTDKAGDRKPVRAVLAARPAIQEPREQKATPSVAAET
jgi:hypothetical protein